MNRLVVALLLLPPLSLPSAAATLTLSYSYYTVRGTSLQQIEQQLQTQGPRIDNSRERHPGATTLEFTTRVRYREEGSRCSIDDVQVRVHAQVVLPRWRDWRKAGRSLRLIWDTLSADIKRHEESHISIAKNHAHMLESNVRSLPRMRSCDDLAGAVNDETQRVLARHDSEQDEFDRVEYINFERRMERLLDYRLEQIESGRLRY
jgi:predicted secreted Zn-dependent protease